MKGLTIILMFCLLGLNGFGQSKKETELRERTYLLSHTVFGTKDSLTLEDLFARKSSYGHSGGKVETREEAIRNISRNKSVYSDTSLTNITVIFENDAAIVRHSFKANEKKADGSVTPLNFTMMLVWVKERGKWKLMGRQAVKMS